MQTLLSVQPALPAKQLTRIYACAVLERAQVAFFSGLAAFGVGEDEGCTGGAGAFAGGSDHAPDDLAAAAQGCRVRATGATPGEPALVKAEANTNISCGKTVIPAVRYEIPAGTVELVTEVLVREWESLGPSRGPLAPQPAPARPAPGPVRPTRLRTPPRPAPALPHVSPKR